MELVKQKSPNPSEPSEKTSPEFVKQTSPHFKRRDNLTWMLLDVIIALSPVIIWAFVVYPLDAVRTFPLSIATMELAEFIFVLITKKTYKEFHLQNFLTAMISALIFSLIMPVNPGWENGMGYVAVIFGALIGIVLGKLLFGGTGNNIFNPAALGMVVARLAWADSFSNTASGSLITSSFIDTEITAGATAMGISGYSEISWDLLREMFLGQVAGSLGEGFKIAILLGLVYLLIRRTVDWRTVLSYAGTFIFLMLIASLFVSSRLGDFSYVGKFTLYEILGGGFLFGVTYMITDPVTGPATSPGRVIYGCFGAIVAVCIRLFTVKPEGVGYSILFANMIAPILDYPAWTSQKWKKWHYITLGCLLGIAVLAVCLVMNYKEAAVA